MSTNPQDPTPVGEALRLDPNASRLDPIASRPDPNASSGSRSKKRRAFAFTLMAYGLFLIAIGIAGYVNNPENAKTALISGGGFGAVHLVWAFLWNRVHTVARYGAAVTLVMVLAASTWRSWASWQAYLAGDPSKQFVAFLLTAMFLGTLRVFLRFLMLPKA